MIEIDLLQCLVAGGVSLVISVTFWAIYYFTRRH